MIRINLLPVEKRRKERTPLPRLGLVMLDASVLAVVVVYCIFVFLQIVAKEGEIADLSKKLNDLKPFVEQHAKLTEQIKKVETSVTEVEKTAKRNIEWWRAVDMVWEVFHNNPRVWVEDITITEGRSLESAVKKTDPGFKGTIPYGITLKCFCAGKDVAVLTKFRRDLRNHPELKKWFIGINADVSWTISSADEYVEKYSMPFEVVLIGRPSAAPEPARPQGRRK